MTCSPLVIIATNYVQKQFLELDLSSLNILRRSIPRMISDVKHPVRPGGLIYAYKTTINNMTTCQVIYLFMNVP